MVLPIESSPPPGWDRKGIDLLVSALPPGQLSEIVGPRSSGATSLLLALLARTTAAGRLAAVVDTWDSFDPTGAAEAGADLHALLWVRCGGRVSVALRAADLLARCPGFSVVALDLGELPVERRSPAPAAWFRLQRAVRGSQTVLVVRAPRHLAGSTAALVLGARKRQAQWIGSLRSTRLAGLVSEVQVLRSRAGALPANPAPDTPGWSITWRP
jgi:hypothetical protein